MKKIKYILLLAVAGLFFSGSVVLAYDSYSECDIDQALECSETYPTWSDEECDDFAAGYCEVLFPEESEGDGEASSYTDHTDCVSSESIACRADGDSVETCDAYATALCDAIFSDGSTEEGGVGGDSGSTTGGTGGGSSRVSGTIQNPLGTGTTIDDIYVNVVNAILGIVGGLAFLVFVFNGFRFIFAAGNEETVSKAKKGMVWSMAGVLLILMAYTIVQYVFTSFFG